MQQTTINLRYLLWRAQAPPETWPARLAAWAGCEVARAADLLRGSDLRPEEQQRVAHACQIPEETLVFASLLGEEGINILKENIAFLTGGLQHGGKLELATHLGVDASTISRWRAGARPRPAHVHRLHAYFQLPAHVDLYTEPLFLSDAPLTMAQQRAWLRERVDALGARTLQELFPALQRLLREP